MKLILDIKTRRDLFQKTEEAFYISLREGVTYVVWVSSSPKHLCVQAVLDPLLSNLRDFRESFTVGAVIPDTMCVCVCARERERERERE